MNIINSEHSIGDMVYLKTDKDQYKRMVTQICLDGAGVRYCLCCGTQNSWHYNFEITIEKDILITTSEV